MVLSWGTWDLQHSLWHARSLVAACKMLLAACRIQFPVQFSSVAQSCLILCNPMNCSMPGLPVHHQLPSTPKPMSRWCHPTISSSVVPFSSCSQSFPASGSFPMSYLFVSDDPNPGASASASASVIPVNIQTCGHSGRRRTWKRNSLSHVPLFATPWTIRSLEFSRPENWGG